MHKNEKALNTLHEQEILPFKEEPNAMIILYFHSEMSQVQAISETGLSLFQATQIKPLLTPPHSEQERNYFTAKVFKIYYNMPNFSEASALQKLLQIPNRAEMHLRICKISTSKYF